MKRTKGLTLWVGLHNSEGSEIEGKRDKGEKSFYGEACSIDRKGVGIRVFQL